jgi:hypothetical protein
MNPELPVDKRESESLELKSRAALDEPDKIARGAVAMWKSGPGAVWIGIKEGQERNEVEPIPDPEAARERRRLQDHLLDVIEPTPIAGEVMVSDEPVGSGTGEEGRVLRVTLRPLPERRPYAFRRHGGWHFLRRVGDRIVPMSRDEIVGALQVAPRSAEPDTVPQVLRMEVKALLEQAAARFWLGIEPESAGELDLRKLLDTELLTDPTLSNTPRGSYNFTAPAYRGAARVDRSRGRAAVMTGDNVVSLRVLASGGVRFEAALEEIFRVGRVPFVDEERLLSPEALLGYLVSVARLVGTLLGKGPPLWRQLPQGDLWAALGITGLEGWGLLPGDLAAWPANRYQIRRFQDKDLLLQEPLRFSQEQLRDHPDECGMRLVEQIYDAFEIDQLPSIDGAPLGHAGLPTLEPEGYSRWVSLDLGGGTRKIARLRRDNLRPSRYEWETRDGALIPAGGRWVHGWSSVE